MARPAKNDNASSDPVAAANKDEKKTAVFIKLAEKRTNVALKQFRLLSNLKSANYKSTPKMRDRICNALREGLNELEAIWAGDKADKSAFSLTDEHGDVGE